MHRERKRRPSVRRAWRGLETTPQRTGKVAIPITVCWVRTYIVLCAAQNTERHAYIGSDTAHFEPDTAHFEPDTAYSELRTARFKPDTAHFGADMARFGSDTASFELRTARFSPRRARFEPPCCGMVWKPRHNAGESSNRGKNVAGGRKRRRFCWLSWARQSPDWQRSKRGPIGRLACPGKSGGMATALKRGTEKETARDGIAPRA